MDLSEIVSVSGLGGLHRVVVQREDGLVVTPLGENKNRFVSKRKHTFTPLDGITVYTETDSVELKQVLQNMKKEEEDIRAPSPKKAGSEELKDYFREVLPEYDDERVYVSDIKKIIKWYNQLNEHGLIEVEDEEETGQQESDQESPDEKEDRGSEEGDETSQS
jgi:hypothetical protein